MTDIAAPPLPAGATPIEVAPPLPAGATPIAPLAPPQQQSQLAPPPQKFAPIENYVDDDVYRMSQKYGIAPKMLRGIASIETGGQADPTNAVSSKGAIGPMQLMPGTFHEMMGDKANIRDPHANIEAGAKYFKQMLDRYHGDYVLAAGAYNAGPGAIDDYLAGRHGLGPETLTYMARVSSLYHDQNTMPIPLHQVQAHPTQAGKNTAPENAKHNWLDQFAGLQDAPFIFFAGKELDRMHGTGDKYLMDAFHLYIHDPAAAAAKFGPNSQLNLESYAKYGNDVQKSIANYMLKNPMATGAATFVEEFFNPVGWLAGGAIGKIGMGALRVAKMIPGGEQLINTAAHMFSPWKNIVADHGEIGRDVMAAAGSRMARRGELATKLADKVFAGFTPAERKEIVRRQQYLHREPGTWTGDAKREAEIDKAADLARDITRNAIAEALHLGGLRKDFVGGARGSKPTTLAHPTDPTKAGISFDFDPGTYVPIHHAYAHPTSPGQFAGIMGIGDFASMVMNATKKNASKIAKFGNVDEARNATGKFKLPEDQWDPAQGFTMMLKQMGNNTEFGKALTKLDELSRGIGKAGALMNGSVKGVAPMFTLDENVAKQFGMKRYIVANVPGIDKEAGSDLIRKGYVSPAFQEFLKGKTIQALTGQGEATDGIGQFFEKYNSLMRAMIINNPLYHPFWNIATNASAAASTSGAGIARAMPLLMRNYARAVIGTGISVAGAAEHIPIIGTLAGKSAEAGTKMLEQPFWSGVMDYQKAVTEAAEAGAMASSGASNKTLMGNLRSDIRATPYSALTWSKKVDKFLEAAGEWNKQATFGKNGEEAFATTLFANLKKAFPHLEDEQVAWRVREALGNYHNVDPNNVLSKYLFFYPWLKSNVPFWAKTFLTKPAYVTAPLQGSMRERQISGDPRFGDPQYEESPFALYAGRGKDGSDAYYTPPLPAKDALKLGGAMDPLSFLSMAMGHSGGPTIGDRVQTVEQTLASRLQPGAGALFDTMFTAMDSGAHEAGSYQGYTSMFDKLAPGQTQVAQAVVGFGEKVLPVPAPFLAQDLERGFKPDRATQYAVEALGLGFISRREADAVRAGERKQRMAMQRGIYRIEKAYHNNALTAQEAEQKKAEIYHNAQAAQQRMIDHMAAQKPAESQPTGAPPLPPGATVIR